MVARESLILGVSRFSVRLEVKLSPVNGYVDVLSTSCRRLVDVLSTSCRRLQEKDDERRPRSFLLIRESRFVACRGELSKEAFECVIIIIISIKVPHRFLMAIWRYGDMAWTKKIPSEAFPTDASSSFLQ